MMETSASQDFSVLCCVVLGGVRGATVWALIRHASCSASVRTIARVLGSNVGCPSSRMLGTLGVQAVVCVVALFFYATAGDRRRALAPRLRVSQDRRFCVVVGGDVSGSWIWRLACGASLPRTRCQLLWSSRGRLTSRRQMCGPIVCGIDATPVVYWESGCVFTAGSDHVISVVGWGEDAAQVRIGSCAVGETVDFPVVSKAWRSTCRLTTGCCFAGDSAKSWGAVFPSCGSALTASPVSTRP